MRGSARRPKSIEQNLVCYSEYSKLVPEPPDWGQLTRYGHWNV